MGMLHSHTSQPKSSLSYPIGHCKEQYFPRSGQESSERVEGEVILTWAQQSIKGKGMSCYGAAHRKILVTESLVKTAAMDTNKLSRIWARLCCCENRAVVKFVWHQQEQTGKYSVVYPSFSMQNHKKQHVRRNVSYSCFCKSVPETFNPLGWTKSEERELTIETLAEQTSIFVLLEAVGAVIPGQGAVFQRRAQHGANGFIRRL